MFQELALVWPVHGQEQFLPFEELCYDAVVDEPKKCALWMERSLVAVASVPKDMAVDPGEAAPLFCVQRQALLRLVPQQEQLMPVRSVRHHGCLEQLE